MKKVLGKDNALFFSSLWKHLLANTLLLHNLTYFYVAKEDPQVCNFMNTATGALPRWGVRGAHKKNSNKKKKSFRNLFSKMFLTYLKNCIFHYKFYFPS